MTNFFLRIITSIALIFLLYLSLQNSIVLFIVLLLLNFFTMIEFDFLFKNIFKKKKFVHFVSIILSYTYITLFSLVLWSYLMPVNNNNNIVIVFLLIICISTDIGGFIFGKLIGGKKLTQISPNKTYAGAIGSFCLSIVFGYLYYIYFKHNLEFNLDIIFIVLIISSISQLGDLVISFLKRKANVKDTGKVLPGHGGILDRIDGMIVALPVGIMLISI